MLCFDGNYIHQKGNDNVTTNVTHILKKCGPQKSASSTYPYASFYQSHHSIDGRILQYSYPQSVIWAFCYLGRAKTVGGFA